MRLSFVVLIAAVAPALAQSEATPWIGVSIGPGSRGVLVKQVVEASPADRAGLKIGDEILSLDGEIVHTAQELITRVQRKGVGQKVTLQVARGADSRSVALNLDPRPDQLDLLRRHLVDKPAPTFDFPESKGPHPASLAGLKGQVVVLDFFATWCGPCNASIPTLSAWQSKYGDKGLRVVGVSTEPMDVLSRHIVERKMGYTVAHDPGEVNVAYLVPVVPMFVVIDRAGKVRAVEVGAGDRLDAVEAAFRPLLEP